MALFPFSQGHQISHTVENSSLTCMLYQYILSTIFLVRRYYINWELPYHFLILPLQLLIFIKFVLLHSFWWSLFSIESPLVTLLNKERSKVSEEAGKVGSKSLPWEGKEQSFSITRHLQSQEDQASLTGRKMAGLARCSSFPSCWKEKLTEWADRDYYWLIICYI